MEQFYQMTLPLKPDSSRIIGITGGSSLIEVGPPSYVSDFFLFFNRCVSNLDEPGKWTFMVDRLYRRYVMQEQLAPTLDLLKKASELDSESTYEKIFSAIYYCAESATVNFEGFKNHPRYQYEPVRIVVANMPWFVVEKSRSLIEYDQLKDEAFWLKL